MTRIPDVDPVPTTGPIATVLQAQTERWGQPLANHLLYARRPSIFRGARAMWGGLDQSGLLAPGLVALLNRRVALINHCPF